MDILLIKLSALGDVLRTTPLLTALKSRHPSARITWLVDAQSREVLENNPLLDELLSSSAKVVEALSKRDFDWLINLDKETEALEAAVRVPAARKSGFGRTPEGELCALDRLSDYAVRLGVDDELKFRKNRKTYQEISFEQAGLEFNGEPYLLPLDGDTIAGAAAYLERLGAGLRTARPPLVGLNTGSGRRFAGKRLPVSHYLELARRLVEELGAAVFLLGGEDEVEQNREIERLSRVPVVNTGSHPIRRFAAIVKRCDVVVSGDTTAMHVAIAVQVPVVVHFGSTCEAEIELYGRGRKLVSSIACAPCYKRVCPIGEQCMKDTSVDEIFQAVKELAECRALRK